MSVPQLPVRSAGPDAAPAKSPALSRKTMFTWASGALLDQWGIHGFKITANQILNLVLGVSPVTVGFVTMLGQLWEAATDAVTGSLSDNTRHRWGRRRPWILAGALGCAAVFPFVWRLPANLSSGGQAAWLTASILVFYTFFSCFTVPYHAFGYELAPNYHDKTRMMAMRMIFALPAIFAVNLIFPFLQTGWLGAPAQGVRILAWGFGVVFAATAIWPALLLREPARPVAAQAAPKVSLAAGMRTVFGNRAAAVILAISFIGGPAVTTVSILGTYVTIYHSFHGEARAATWVLTVNGLVAVTFTLIASWLVPPFARRVSKKPALQWLLALGLLASLLKWVAFNPVWPMAQVMVLPLMQIAAVGLTLLAESMLADASDEEEYRSGRRIAGNFSAAYAWVNKAGFALASGLSGVVLAATGFEVSRGASQPEGTVTAIRLLFALGPAVLFTLCWFLLRYYPLTEARMAEVHRAAKTPASQST